MGLKIDPEAPEGQAAVPPAAAGNWVPEKSLRRGDAHSGARSWTTLAGWWGGRCQTRQGREGRRQPYPGGVASDTGGAHCQLSEGASQPRAGKWALCSDPGGFKIELQGSGTARLQNMVKPQERECRSGSSDVHPDVLPVAPQRAPRVCHCHPTSQPT